MPPFSLSVTDVGFSHKNVSSHPIPVSISAVACLLSSFFGMCQIILKFLKNKLAGIAKKILKMMYNQRRFAFPDRRCTPIMLITTTWLSVQEQTVEWNRRVYKQRLIWTRTSGMMKAKDELFNKF